MSNISNTSGDSSSPSQPSFRQPSQRGSGRRARPSRIPQALRKRPWNWESFQQPSEGPSATVSATVSLSSSSSTSSAESSSEKEFTVNSTTGAIVPYIPLEVPFSDDPPAPPSPTVPTADGDTACDQAGEEDKTQGLLKERMRRNCGCFHGSETSFRLIFKKDIFVLQVFVFLL